MTSSDVVLIADLIKVQSKHATGQTDISEYRAPHYVLGQICRYYMAVKQNYA